MDHPQGIEEGTEREGNSLAIDHSAVREGIEVCMKPLEGSYHQRVVVHHLQDITDLKVVHLLN